MIMLRRAIAYFIDILLLAAPFFLLNWLYPTLLLTIYPWGQFLGFTAGLIYFTLLDCRATVGKKLLKLQIVDNQEQPITHLIAALRYIIIGVPLYLIAVINYVTTSADGTALWLLLILIQAYLVIFNRKNNALIQDIFCHTHVIATNKKEKFHPHTTPRKHVVAIEILTALVVLSVAITYIFPDKIFDKYFFNSVGITMKQFDTIVEGQKAENKEIAAITISSYLNDKGVVIDIIATTNNPERLKQIAQQTGEAFAKILPHDYPVAVNIITINDFGLSKVGQTLTNAWTNTSLNPIKKV